MLKCPRCGSANLKVIDSRNDNRHPGAYRRRVCKDCKKRFNTYELSLSDDEIDDIVTRRLEKIRETGEHE